MAVATLVLVEMVLLVVVEAEALNIQDKVLVVALQETLVVMVLVVVQETQVRKLAVAAAVVHMEELMAVMEEAVLLSLNINFNNMENN